MIQMLKKFKSVFLILGIVGTVFFPKVSYAYPVFAQNAYQNGIIVINPDGTTTLVDYSRFLNLTGNSKIDIYPHSVIYVPREIAKLDELTKSSYIAQIVSTASLPVLTLISIIDRD